MMNISGKRCLLDTNVLVFARNKTSPNHKTASKIFLSIEKKEFEAYISIQNILEFFAVLTRGYKLTQKEAKYDLDLLLTNPHLNLIYPPPSALKIILDLLSSPIKIYIYDLFLASTAIANDINIIITDDNDFTKINNLKVFNPFQKN